MQNASHPSQCPTNRAPQQKKTHLLITRGLWNSAEQRDPSSQRASGTAFVENRGLSCRIDVVWQVQCDKAEPTLTLNRQFVP